MIKTKEEFKELVASIEDFERYKKPLAFGVARVDFGQVHTEKVIHAVYPLVNWNENFGSGAVIIRALIENGIAVDFNESEIVATLNSDIVNDVLEMFNPFLEEAKADKNSHKNIQVFLTLQELFEEHDYNNYKVTILFSDEAPKSVESVYLKLYALSLGKAKLRGINLNGAFGILPNLAWTGNIPIELDYLRENEIELKLKDEYPEIDFVDKFPRFLQHIIPADNTRILDTSKVRFGAQLAAGTTVMPGASYINFNAGTEGPVMVEGRISSSAVVKKGADVGGGASILGVLSGTNGNPVTIGENTLLGANSVTGIPLGDGCIVDAGIAVLEGTKITISEKERAKIKEVNPDFDDSKEVYKGLELAGLNGIHYRFDTTIGKMVAFRSVREVKLNEELH
jgi:2,3,4,5-tetrahydropyridine-2-carboxylate N-succinyltransferase